MMIDNFSHGIALRDFRRVSDDSEFPANYIGPYDSGLEEAESETLVFKPSSDGLSGSSK
jgi:hypothetical protein